MLFLIRLFLVLAVGGAAYRAYTRKANPTANEVVDIYRRSSQ